MALAVDVETGVLSVPFNETASWGPVRHLFLKPMMMKYKQWCTSPLAQWPPTSLSILVRASLCCSLESNTHICMKSSASWQFVTWNSLPFLVKKKCDEFQKTGVLFLPFWVYNGTHKCWCSRYSTSIISTSVFSCAHIIAKGVSNDQFENKSGLVIRMCYWNTGPMGAENNPLCAYVDIPFHSNH